MISRPIQVRIVLDDGTDGTFVSVAPVGGVVGRTRDESFLYAVAAAAGEAFAGFVTNIATSPGWAKKVCWGDDVRWSDEA